MSLAVAVLSFDGAWVVCTGSLTSRADGTLITVSLARGDLRTPT